MGSDLVMVKTTAVAASHLRPMQIAVNKPSTGLLRFRRAKTRGTTLAAGRAALLVIQLKASRGSRTEYETIGPTRLWGCQILSGTKS